MAELLKPGGHLICLEFPTGKSPSAGGPPWGVPAPLHEALLTHPGEEIEYDEEGKAVLSEPGSKALRRLAHFQPERTHEVGAGTDWVSIWTKD